MSQRKLAQTGKPAHIESMQRILRMMILGGGLWLANVASAQYSSAQLTVRPYVQANGVIDMSLAANWTFRAPGFGSSRAGINTQFQAYNGVPMNIGGYSTYTRTFNNQSVPFCGRVPFVGGLFRNRAQFQRRAMGDFSVRATTVDPAGNPTVRPGAMYRLPIPKMYGLIPPTPIQQR